MDSSIFMDKDQEPGDKDPKRALRDKYELWMAIRDRVLEPCPDGRGIRIPVNSSPDLKDIYNLIDFKLSY